MQQRIDLHTHSNCSDGVLAPAALVDLAATRQVQLLALTDHDTTSGCDEAQSACDRHGISFVPGVELTSQWRDREIHVIGLGINRGHAPFIAHCASVLELRRERIRAMGQRLTLAGLPGEELVAEALSAAAPTRAHLARGLCSRGLAATVQAALTVGSSAAGPDMSRPSGRIWPARCNALARRPAWRCWLIRTVTRCPMACCANWSNSSRPPAA
jgi:hypothetical protein